MRAGETFLKQRDLDKAIENWSRVTALQPEQPLAHSRLATAHEHLGHKQQAVTEYLAVASILQRGGNAEKAQEVVNKALQLMPQSPEARQAQVSAQDRPASATALCGPRAARVRCAWPRSRSSRSPQRPSRGGWIRSRRLHRRPSPSWRRSSSTTATETPAGEERRGLAAIVKGTGRLSMQHAEQTKVVLHLGQAIDAQTRGDESSAADELERALEAGFDHAALHFDLGYLRFKGDRLESAIRHLAHAVQHRDYGLGARLLLGEILFKKGIFKDASLEYLEALRLADASTADRGSGGRNPGDCMIR